MIVLITIIALSLLILAHEAGHFFAAKWFKMKVDEFGFGFPPRMFAWRPRIKNKETLRQAPAVAEALAGKQGETEYSINWLPFGGFVKIAGETDRILEGYEKMQALPEEQKKRLFLFQPAHKRAIVILAGVFINFVVGWALLSGLFMAGTPQMVVVTGVRDNSAAQSAGIMEGDIVRGYASAKDFIDLVNSNKGEEIELTVLRNGEIVEIKAVPSSDAGPNEGALGVFLADGGIPKYGFFRAIWEGLKETWEITKLTFISFVQLITNLIGRAKLMEGVVGPLGIFGVAVHAGKVGLIYLVQLIALISVNLAVINLIPFPALDGGRLFLILVEKIKGSPISPKIEGVINGLGFVFLILLMVLLTVRDTARIF